MCIGLLCTLFITRCSKSSLEPCLTLKTGTATKKPEKHKTSTP